MRKQKRLKSPEDMKKSDAQGFTSKGAFSEQMIATNDYLKGRFGRVTMQLLPEEANYLPRARHVTTELKIPLLMSD